MRNQLAEVAAALEKLGRVATTATFSLLDYRLDLTPLEDRPATSWEVEREQFVRRLPDSLA